MVSLLLHASLMQKIHKLQWPQHLHVYNFNLENIVHVLCIFTYIFSKNSLFIVSKIICKLPFLIQISILHRRNVFKNTTCTLINFTRNSLKYGVFLWIHCNKMLTKCPDQLRNHLVRKSTPPQKKYKKTP